MNRWNHKPHTIKSPSQSKAMGFFDVHLIGCSFFFRFFEEEQFIDDWNNDEC